MGASSVGRWVGAALVLWVVVKLALHHDIMQAGPHPPPSTSQDSGGSAAPAKRAMGRPPSPGMQPSSLTASPAAQASSNTTGAPSPPSTGNHRSLPRTPPTSPAPQSVAQLPPETTINKGSEAQETKHKARKMGTKKRVLVVEDAECQYRPPEAIKHCSSLTSAFSASCGHYGFDSHYHHGYIAAFRILEPYMAAVGVPNYHAVRYDSHEMKRMVKSADVIITVAVMVPKLLRLTSAARFVVIERLDAAPLVEDNLYDINSQRVVAVLKHTSLHPVSRNNDDLLIHGRHHYVQIDPNLAAAGSKRSPPLPPSALRKVHAMVPQVFRFRFPLECGGKRQYLHLLPALEGPLPQPDRTSPPGQPGTDYTVAATAAAHPKPLANRSIDIAFLGGTQNHDVLKKHRAKAASAIKGMGARHTQLKVVAGLEKTKTVAEFYELLRDVRFFVSPYGYGEFANKDYEAILCGCVLVKPLAHQLTAFPNIYKPGVSAVDVKADFSNLDQVLMPLLGALPKAQAIADHALGQLRKFSAPQLVAEHVSAMLHDVVG